MKQLEIQFFWPLTEQIPLDLDFTECQRPSISMPIISDGRNYVLAGSNHNTTVIASQLTIDSESTTIVLKQKPNIIQRVLFKLLGLKWKFK